MKKKPGFTVRSVCGEQFLIAEGMENIDFSNLISLNDTSAYLWGALKDGEEFTADDLVRLLLAEYDVSEAEARADVLALVDDMRKFDVVTD